MACPATATSGISVTEPPLIPGSWLFGSARELRADPLGPYREVLESGRDLVRFRVGPPRVGFQFDAVLQPDGARQVLATDFGRYRKEAPVFDEIARFLGEGLLTSDGDRWRRDRRILQPLFTRKRVSSYVGTIGEAADDLVRSWLDDAIARRPVDLHDSALRYALDALGRAILGDDVVDARPVLKDALPLLSQHAVRRGLAIVRLPPSLPTPANRRAAAAQAEVYALVDRLIARRRAADHAADDLLGLLLAARDPDGTGGIDDRGIRDQVLVFLLGGHETTASALALTLQLLATHPEVQERARAEAAGVLGDRRADPEDVEQLRYTGRVVDEALRLYPPGHTVVRTAVEEVRLLDHEVPRGRIVALSFWGIHHNPSVWPDPERFDPDRFEPSGSGEDAVPGRPRYSHLPFGGGPRACIGVHLALSELVIAIAAVLRAYRLRAVVAEPNLDVGLTLRPLGPLPCRLEPVGTNPARRVDDGASST
jgi:cytochrome P450